jgi:phosphoglycolate phosphatase
MAKIPLIIFDFDGTIANTFVMVEKIIDKYKADYILGYLTDQDMESFRGKEIWEIVKKLKIPIFKLPFLIAKIQSSLNQLIDAVKPFKNMDKLIKTLHEQGFELGIVTTNSQKNVQQFLLNHQLEYFSFIKTANFILGKTSVLKTVLKEKNLKAEDVIYIGDEVRDIEACQSVGINIIAVSWGYQTKAILQHHQPDFLVDKPEEITNLITNYQLRII